MGVNKVIYNTKDGMKTLVDLTSDTVTPETLAEGETAHDATGKIIVGTAIPVQVTQEAGQSEALIMSQKAVTDLVARKVDVATLEDIKGDIVNDIIAELQGLPVFGVVDENNTITVTSQLSSGTYTLKYENTDGTTTEIGTIKVGNGEDSEPDYTNQIKEAVNADGDAYVGHNGEEGYSAGYRINSSGVESQQEGMCCTGFIPYNGETIRLKNITVNGTKTAYFVYCNADKSLLQVDALTNILVDDGNGVYTGTAKVSCSWIRITCGVIDDTTILTLNEEIV